MEPALLLPIGFGTILVNLPLSGAVTQGEEVGVLTLLFDSGIANELFPLLLFIGIGAMIDFEPLLSNPKLFLFGAAAQFGIFFTLSMARLFNFDLHDAASIAIIGAADGPTSIFVANVLNSQYIGAITVAAYSYMALVPIVQPPVIRLLTTKTERRIRMAYTPGSVSKTTKILFPVLITAVVGIVSNRSAALIGFFDVRQSAARVRRVKQPFGCRAERAVQLDHPDSRHHDHRTYDSGGIFARGHAAYFRTGPHCIRV